MGFRDSKPQFSKDKQPARCSASESCGTLRLEPHARERSFGLSFPDTTIIYNHLQFFSAGAHIFRTAPLGGPWNISAILIKSCHPQILEMFQEITQMGSQNSPVDPQIPSNPPFMAHTHLENRNVDARAFSMVFQSLSMVFPSASIRFSHGFSF